MDSNKVQKWTLVLVCMLAGLKILEIAAPLAVWFQQRFIENGGNSQRGWK
jgi:hypothetical protein